MLSARLLPRVLPAIVAWFALLGACLPASAQDSVGQASQSTDAVSTMPPAPPEDKPIDAQTAVRLSYVEGSVHIYDAGGKLFDQALQNMTILPGMAVETGNDGRAELEFADGSLVRVTPNSAILLGALFHGKVSQDVFTLKPTRGLTYFELSSVSTTLAIEVGPLTAQPVRTPLLMRVNLDAQPYEAALLSGSAQFTDDSGYAAYVLHANETAKIDPAAATNYDIVQDVAPDSWDAWNTDRDSARAQIAGATHPEGESGGPGWNDLNYYGSWYDVPGQGVAWAPDGVGQDFDPYGSGAWGYSTSAGYGWVSSYPWGWLPYHCGVWNFYPGNGWMWLPSSCGWGAGRHWRPYTPVRNAPPRYRLPFRPSPPGQNRRPVSGSLALIAVNQGPAVRFRGLGEPRPVTRALVVSGVRVQPLPLEPRPSYSSVGVVNGFRSTPESPGFSQPGQFSYGAGSRMLTPGSSAPPRITQAPRVSSSPPHVSAPPTVAAPPAPHVAAPAPSAPSGHGH